jgi:hypothetical protein
MLLISVLATDSLSEVEEKTPVVASLKSTQGRCPVTGQKTFGAALQAALASPDFTKRMTTLNVTRQGEHLATIGFDIGCPKATMSGFAKSPKWSDPPGLFIYAMLHIPFSPLAVPFQETSE